jgi:CBS domain-containing protein
MTASVVTVPTPATRAHIADVLTQHWISAAPVVDDTGAVVGLVSEHDLLSKSGAAAMELMTTAVISVSPDFPLSDLRHLLVERRIGRVPVLRDGRLVGICRTRTASSAARTSSRRWRANGPARCAASPSSDTMVSPQTWRDHCRQMVLIRAFELRATEVYQRAKIGGYCHLNLGQEATVVGLMAALLPRDYLFTTYREHGYGRRHRGTSRCR